MNIGENLNKLRKNKNMTQEQIAKLLGIGTNSYQKYELNSRKPNIDMLIKLSVIFEVSIDELILGETSINELKEFINNFQNDFLDISNRDNVIYDKGFLDGLKTALKIIEGDDY